MKNIKNFLLGKRITVLVIMSFFLLGSASLFLEARSYGRAYLGVYVERLSKDEKEEFGVSHGVIVNKVTKESAADKSGIKAADVIQYFDGEKIRRPDNLKEAVRFTKPGTEVKVKLIRNKKSLTLTVTMGRVKSRKDNWFGRKGLFFLHEGRGYLGVHIHQLNKDLAAYFGVKENEGVLILKVEEDSSAEEAGLKSGDVIIKMDDDNIAHTEDVFDILSDFHEGDEIEIEVIRHNKSKKFKIELQNRHRDCGFKILKYHRNNKCLSLPGLAIDFPDFNLIWKEKFNKKMAEKLKSAENKINKKLKLIEKHYPYMI